MIKIDKEWLKSSYNVKYFYILGEIKLNGAINSNDIQKNKFLEFCQMMNSKNTDNYFILFYIFNGSYINYPSKTFYEGKHNIWLRAEIISFKHFYLL